MTADLEKRLKRLVEELEDIADIHGIVGFGIVVSADPLSDDIWSAVARHNFGGISRICVENRNFWTVPFAQGTGCISWWGRKDGVVAIQGWATKAAAILSRHNKLGKEFKGREGSELLKALCSIVAQDHLLSSRIGAPGIEIPPSLTRVRLSSKLDGWTMDHAASTLAEILEHLLGYNSDAPGISFDEDMGVWTISGTHQKKRFRIVWDTRTSTVMHNGHVICTLNKLQSQYCQAVLDARGEPRVGRQIFGTAVTAFTTTTVTRIWHSLPEALQSLIERTRGKGSRLRTELLK